MKFSFPLQTLLNWKRNLEEFSQVRLAEKNARLRKQEEEIQRLAEIRFSYDQELKEKSQKGIPAGEYVLYKRFAENSRTDLLVKEDKKKNTIREIETERETLITLTKEKKILEKLKEKRWKSFIYQMEKAEQKGNDEMVTLKHRPARGKDPS